MEIKKSSKANLEYNKKTWFIMGIIVVLALVFIALEWNVFKKVEPRVLLSLNDDDIEKILLPIILPDEPLPPPPPPPTEDDIIYIITQTDENSIGGKGLLQIIIDEEGLIELIRYIPLIDEEIVDPPDEHPIFEEMPEFPGGNEALTQFLKKNIKYPNISKEQGIKGRVIVDFIVGKDGSIQDEKIIRSIDKHLDNEVLRLVKSMPKWKPGKVRGRPVKVRYTLPVMFELKELH